MVDNNISKEEHIITQICQILSEEANHEYDSLSYRGEIYEDSLTSYFTLIRDGLKVKRFLFDNHNILAKLGDLVFDLHETMKNHTGGNWKILLLTLDENGEAEVKFEYSNVTSRAEDLTPTN